MRKVSTRCFSDRLHEGFLSLMAGIILKIYWSKGFGHTTAAELLSAGARFGRRLRAICIPPDDRIAVSSTFDRR